jgi:hypothetical protein
MRGTGIMSDKRQINQGGVCTIRKPRVVLVGGVGDKRLTEQLRALDWDVASVPAGDDLACSVLARRPSAVVLPVETGWESGYLLAAKLRKAKPKLKVVLVAANRSFISERFARFVGATLLTESEIATRLAQTL